MCKRTYVLLCSDRKLTSLVAGEASPSSAWATGSLTGFWEFVCAPLVRYRVSSTASSLLDATVLLQFADLNISFYMEQSYIICLLSIVLNLFKVLIFCNLNLFFYKINGNICSKKYWREARRYNKRKSISLGNVNDVITKRPHLYKTASIKHHSNELLSLCV